MCRLTPLSSIYPKVSYHTRRAFKGSQFSFREWRWVAIQMEISMHVRIFHFSPNLRTNDIDLLLRVVQKTCEKGVKGSFETFRDLEVVPGADFFLQCRIS